MDNSAIGLSNAPEQFRQAMIEAGIGIDELPIDDGQLHRFKVEGDKNGSNNGWYVLFGDNNPKGCFGSWKSGINGTWSLNDYKEYTQQEKAEYAKQMAQAKKERDKAQAIVHKEARTESEKLWSNAKPETGGHKYLVDKGVMAYRIRSDGFKLLISLRDTSGILHSLQTIDGTGKKLFLPGGAIKGNYFSIGKPKNILVIVEGYATGASIYEATGHAVAVAFNAGNLLPVAISLRKRFPDIGIIIAGDNDQWTEDNPGVTKATEAANAVNGKVVIPEFTNTESKPTDFNDLHQLEGLNTVKNCIDGEQPGKETDGSPGDSQVVIQKIKELASLTEIEYDNVRKSEAKAMGVREKVLDKEVDKERKYIELDLLTHNSIVSDVEEWPQPVHGEQLISELQGIYKQYAILPDGAEIALALWTLGTYCFNAFRIYPMIGLSSPEKRCGKSTVLSLLYRLTNKPLLSSNISPAAIYRVTELCQPTLLIDEADTHLKDNDELRGIINSGHTQDTAFVIRCEGEQNEPKKFSTWAPKAIAMIGDLPDTNKDRSIVIIMRRKLSDETVLKMPLNGSEQFNDVRQKCKRWATDNFELLTKHAPTLPRHNNDREVDNWTPLFSIADACNQSKGVLTAMMHISPKDEDDGIGPMILGDIRKIFEEQGMDRISSSDLVGYLIEYKDRPWAEWRRGNPITQNSLARLLRPYKIKPKAIRFAIGLSKGYMLEAFEDDFNRYLPPLYPDQIVTPLQTSTSIPLSPIPNRNKNNDVTLQESLKPSPSNDCYGVTDEIGGTEGNEDVKREEVII